MFPTFEQCIMYVVGFLFIYLAITKRMEPALLLPMGFGAISVVSRVVQKLANEEEKGNVILMQAVGANVAGQIGSVVVGGLILSLFSAM